MFALVATRIMSDKQDGLKDKHFSRCDFMKFMGAGSLLLGLGALGISNFKNIGEASATLGAAPYSNNSNTNTTTRNDMGIRGSMIAHIVRFTLKPNAPKDQVDLAFESRQANNTIKKGSSDSEDYGKYF